MFWLQRGKSTEKMGSICIRRKNERNTLETTTTLQLYMFVTPGGMQREYSFCVILAPNICMVGANQIKGHFTKGAAHNCQTTNARRIIG